MLNELHQFFIVTQPGLENLTSDELHLKLTQFQIIDKYSDIKAEEGGISLTCPLEYGFLLNHILKIPTRILLRIDSFKVRDFPKLFNKLFKIKWKTFIKTPKVSIHASCHESRIINSTRVEEVTLDAITKFFQGQAPKQKDLETQKTIPDVYIRLSNDICTVSLDTTGERLNIRGLKTQSVEAPIRETLASAILFATYLKTGTMNCLIDPMCGSGTIMFEVSTFFTPLFGRDFTYQTLALKTSIPAVQQDENQLIARELYGFDISEKAIEAARSNQANYKLLQPLSFQVKDIFQDSNNSSNLHPVIITNPPYNMRIKHNSNELHYFEHLIKTIFKKYSPHYLTIIIPDNYQTELKLINKSYETEKLLKFKNGGISVSVYGICVKNTLVRAQAPLI